MGKLYQILLIELTVYNYMFNSEETLAQKFVKKWFWLYFFTLLIGPIGYIIKIIISNDLSVEGVGMLYGVLSFAMLLSVLNDLGFTESLNYFLPKYIIKNEYWKAKYLLKLTLILQICSSITIAWILFIIAPWLAHNYFNEPLIIDILRISWLYFIGINLFSITSVLFSVSQNTKLQKGTDFIKLLTTGIITFLLFITEKWNIENYMYAWVSGTFIWFIFASYFVYKKYYIVYFRDIKIEPQKNERNIFFKYSLATLVTANIGTLLSQVDTQMIIILLNPEATWYYSNYLSLLNIPFVFISPLLGFLFPVISELHGRDDKVKMWIIHKEFTLYFSIIWVWLSAFFFFFGESLSVLFFGEKFRESWVIMSYSAFFFVFLLLVQINFQFLAGTGKIWERAKIFSIILPINIVLNYILIKLLGVEWSALAVWISWIPLWYLSYKATKVHNSWFNWFEFLKNIGLIVVVLGLFYIIQLWLDIKDTTKLWAFYTIIIAMIINITIFGLWNFWLLKNAWITLKKNK